MLKFKNILNEKLDKKTLRKIKNDDRIVLSPSGLRTFNNVSQLSGGDVKPLGLWYAFGKDWYTAAKRMQFSVDKYNYIYKLDLNINKIIVVTNKNFDEFTNKYCIIVSSYAAIKWGEVEKDYSGIELLCPHGKHKIKVDNNEYFGWTIGWDVRGGCIWDKKAIKKIIKIK